jgi:hypothetical protein
MLAVGLCVATPRSGASDSAAKTNTRATAKKMGYVLAPAENLSGTIMMVGPSDKEVTLVGSNGVPYDFQLTRKTKVELANQKIGVDALAGELNKQATVHFVPTSEGNLAESIQIGPS